MIPNWLIKKETNNLNIFFPIFFVIAQLIQMYKKYFLFSCLCIRYYENRLLVIISILDSVLNSKNGTKPL